MDKKYRKYFIAIVAVFISIALFIAFSKSVSFKKSIYIQPDEYVNNNITNINGDIYVNGIVKGNVKAILGNVYVNGDIDGNVVTIGGTVIAGPKAHIKGSVKQKYSKLTALENKSIIRNNDTASIFNKVGLILTILIISIIIYNVIPTNQINMANSINKNTVIKNLIWGYISILVLPVIFLILMTTIIGIVFIPVVVLAFFIIYLIGFTSLSLFIGRRLLKNKVSNNKYIIVGIIGLFLIKNISILGIGSLISIFFIVPLSMGIALRSKFGKFTPWINKF